MVPIFNNALCCLAGHMVLETGQSASKGTGVKREEESLGESGLPGSGSCHFPCDLVKAASPLGTSGASVP